MPTSMSSGKEDVIASAYSGASPSIFGLVSKLEAIVLRDIDVSRGRVRSSTSPAELAEAAAVAEPLASCAEHKVSKRCTGDLVPHS